MAAPAQVQAPPQAAQTIRVAVDVLEDLMTMVSELVLTRNQLLQLARTQENSAFSVPLQRLSHITSDLQEGVMKTRMQPIGHVWAKFPRLVRDVAHDLGKDVKLVLEGKETELDRTLVEAIKDPLTHIVRNAIDHGLEAPDARLAAGKVLMDRGAPAGLVELAKSDRVRDLWRPIAAANEAFRKRVADRARTMGRAVLVDLSDAKQDVGVKFVTYALFPRSVYSVMLQRAKQHYKLSIGYNPWCGIARDRDIASICQRYGGGGHPAVGAASFPLTARDDARSAAEAVARELA